MRRSTERFKHLLSYFWQGVRDWSGDSAYETYYASMARKKCERRLSRAEFYVEQLNRKYSRPNRCC
jgi:uncharacterized short protein YbdD (DUF466 family)